MTTPSTKKMTLLASLLGLGLSLSGSAMAADQRIVISPILYLTTTDAIDDTFKATVSLSSPLGGGSIHNGSITFSAANPVGVTNYFTWIPSGAGNTPGNNGFYKMVAGTTDIISFKVTLSSTKVGAISCPVPVSAKATDLGGMVLAIALKTTGTNPANPGYTCKTSVYGATSSQGSGGV